MLIKARKLCDEKEVLLTTRLSYVARTVEATERKVASELKDLEQKVSALLLRPPTGTSIVAPGSKDVNSARRQLSKIEELGQMREFNQIKQEITMLQQKAGSFQVQGGCKAQEGSKAPTRSASHGSLTSTSASLRASSLERRSLKSALLA